MRLALDRASCLDWLGELSVPEAQAYLTSLPGVGRKTAACVLLLALGMHVTMLQITGCALQRMCPSAFKAG